VGQQENTPVGRTEAKMRGREGGMACTMNPGGSDRTTGSLACDELGERSGARDFAETPAIEPTST
jgi:hypothetical protein